MTKQVQDKLSYVCSAAMESSLYYQVRNTCDFCSRFFLSCHSWFYFLSTQKHGDRAVCNTHLAMNTFHTFHKLSDFFQLKVLDELITEIPSPSQFLKRVKFFRQASVSCFQTSTFHVWKIFVHIFNSSFAPLSELHLFLPSATLRHLVNFLKHFWYF